MAGFIRDILRNHLNPEEIQNHANYLWDNAGLLPGQLNNKEAVTLYADIAPEDRLFLQNEASRELKAITSEKKVEFNLKLSSSLAQTIQSSQVSISGPPDGVRDAYLAIRQLLPITVWFDLKLNPALPSIILDPGSKSLQEIQKKYDIAICVVPIQSPIVQPLPSNHISIYIRTKRQNEVNLKNAIEDLTAFIESNKYGHIYPTLQTKIDVPSTQLNIIGRTYSILDPIASKTSTQISVQKSATNLMSNISITGGSYTSISSARTEISDRFTVELNFNVSLNDNNWGIFLNNLGRHLERLGEESGTHILMKPHQSLPNERTMIIRGTDKEVDKVFEVRKQIIGWLQNPPILSSPPSAPNGLTFVH